MGSSAGFSNCGVIDNVLNLLRQQLVERGGFPGTTLSHINPEDFFLNVKCDTIISEV